MTAQSGTSWIKKGVMFSILGVALLIVASMWFGNNAGVTKADAHDAVTVRFLIAHQPVGVFEEANTLFGEELYRLSGGSMQLEVFTPSDFGVEGRDMSREEVQVLLDAGDIDVSTAPTSVFAEEVPATNVFLMPFLFENYDVVKKFFGTSEAEGILADVSDATRFEALGYTFSGGFRVIALLEENVQSAAALAGTKIASLGNDVTKASLSAIGVESIITNADSTPGDMAGADGVEVPYTRFPTQTTSIRSIVETNLSVLVTMILADDAFFSSLSDAQQDALREAAMAAALVERDSSIALAAEKRNALIEQGVLITSLSGDEQAALREASAHVYDQYEPEIGSDIIRAARGE